MYFLHFKYTDNYENDNFFNNFDDFLETPKNIRDYSSLGDSESIFDNFDESTLASITRLSDMNNDMGSVAYDHDHLPISVVDNESKRSNSKKTSICSKKREKSEDGDPEVSARNKLLKFTKPKPPPIPMKSTSSDEAARLREAFTNQLKEQERRRLEGTIQMSTVHVLQSVLSSVVITISCLPLI